MLKPELLDAYVSRHASFQALGQALHARLQEFVRCFADWREPSPV